MRNFSLGLLLCCVAAGCDSATMPEDNPNFIDGVVVARRASQSTDVPPGVHVREHPADCGVVFHIGPDTRIYYALRNGRSIEVAQADLAVGTRVRVWADGVMDNSCPGRALAAVIQVAS